jgi:transposase-like protein
MPITRSDPFFWRHYEGEIILLCVRRYLSFPLSYRQMAPIMAERGLPIHIWRWVQIYGPELEKRCRPHLKLTNKSYRVDETYIKVRGQDRYLYRSDSTGQTIDFLLTARRAASAKRFFRKLFLTSANVQPRVINVDGTRPIR